jgi:hypothetical protein
MRLFPLVFIACALSACSDKDHSPSSATADSAPVAPSIPAQKTEPAQETAGPPPKGKPLAMQRADRSSDATKEKTPARESPASNTRSQLRQWENFQTKLDACAAAPTNARDVCLEKVRIVWRSAPIDCATLPDKPRHRCVLFSQQWNSPSDHSSDAVVKHAEEPTATSTSPDDPAPAERNRDSTKQQQDALGARPSPPRSN